MNSRKSEETMIQISQNEERLLQILQTMEIPEFRRDVCELSNLRWLLRNISIRNSQHPQHLEAQDLLRKMLPIGE